VKTDKRGRCRCAKCKKMRRLVEFSNLRQLRSGKFSPKGYCCFCNRKYQKSWYRNLSKKRKAERVARAKMRERELRAKLYVYLLDHPCIDCGLPR
jgi:hypothetical protein